MKFSNKDLLLLFGILIAVIVTLTTMIFNDHSPGKEETTNNTIQPTTGMTSPGLLKKAMDKMDVNSLIR